MKPAFYDEELNRVGESAFRRWEPKSAYDVHVVSVQRLNDRVRVWFGSPWCQACGTRKPAPCGAVYLCRICKTRHDPPRLLADLFCMDAELAMLEGGKSYLVEDFENAAICFFHVGGHIQRGLSGGAVG